MTTKSTAKKPTEETAANNAQALPEPPAKDAGIAAKFVWIQQNVHHVEKTGKVSFGNTQFDHMQEHGLIQVLRPLLRAVNCGVIPDFVAAEQVGNHTFLHLRLTVIDGDQPFNGENSSITVNVHAEGVDSQDKGRNKAMTSGVKYGLQKLFLVPTENVDDVEGSDEGHNTPSTAAQKRKVSKQNAGKLRAAAAAAVEAKHLTNDQVLAKLQAEYDATKVEELTVEQANAFGQWLTEKVSG